MDQKVKRINLTIAEKYHLMDKIVEQCRANKESVSDHLCRLAVENYLSSETEKIKAKQDRIFPPFDEYLEKQINGGKEACYEIPRLLDRGKITPERFVKAYLGAKKFVIQSENTKLLKKVIDNVTIHSKRDTLSQMAISLAEGDLVGILEENQKKMQEPDPKEEFKELVRQKEIQDKHDRAKWQEINPGLSYFLKDYPQSEWDIQLKIYNGEIDIVDEDEDDENSTKKEIQVPYVLDGDQVIQEYDDELRQNIVNKYLIHSLSDTEKERMETLFPNYYK